ncbi:hypothetical protein J6590_088980 [Homalodisca vitripennis]|nr:hypothetical protein J6590_088980 [Homalodisca vitripennis]
MRASLTAASFVLSSPYHSSGPTPSTDDAEWNHSRMLTPRVPHSVRPWVRRSVRPWVYLRTQQLAHCLISWWHRNSSSQSIYLQSRLQSISS